MTALTPDERQLTDAQYTACARALLGMGPGAAHLSDRFALDMLAETCDPETFRRALELAYAAGREAALAGAATMGDRARLMTCYVTPWEVARG